MITLSKGARTPPTSPGCLLTSRYATQGRTRIGNGVAAASRRQTERRLLPRHDPGTVVGVNRARLAGVGVAVAVLVLLLAGWSLLQEDNLSASRTAAIVAKQNPLHF